MWRLSIVALLVILVGVILFRSDDHASSPMEAPTPASSNDRIDRARNPSTPARDAPPSPMKAETPSEVNSKNLLPPSPSAVPTPFAITEKSWHTREELKHATSYAWMSAEGLDPLAPRYDHHLLRRAEKNEGPGPLGGSENIRVPTGYYRGVLTGRHPPTRQEIQTAYETGGTTEVREFLISLIVGTDFKGRSVLIPEWISWRQITSAAGEKAPVHYLDSFTSPYRSEEVYLKSFHFPPGAMGPLFDDNGREISSLCQEILWVPSIEGLELKDQMSTVETINGRAFCRVARTQTIFIGQFSMKSVAD